MSLYKFEDKFPRVGKSTFIHPEAVLIGGVEIGEGCYIGAGAVLRGDFGRIKIGSGSNVQDNCIIHANVDVEALIEDNVLIGHGTVLHGACIIREFATIGMRAIVSEGCEVGAEALLAAGSLLPPGANIPPRQMAMGTPANKFREMSEKQIETNRFGLKMYQGLAARSLAGLKGLDEDGN